MQRDANVQEAQARFERLVNALSADLYRYAYLLCRNQAMAEDLVQETFMRAWRFLDSLRDESKAKSWLMTTLRREFARQFERYQPVFENVELDQVTGGPEMDPEVWTLRRGIARLPAKYREVLLLQVIGGYSGAEMAKMLDLPRATINTRLFRARQKLRDMLEITPGSVPTRGKSKT